MYSKNQSLVHLFLYCDPYFASRFRSKFPTPFCLISDIFGSCIEVFNYFGSQYVIYIYLALE